MLARAQVRNNVDTLQVSSFKTTLNIFSEKKKKKRIKNKLNIEKLKVDEKNKEGKERIQISLRSSNLRILPPT